MANKNFFSRIQQKHDSEANWLKAQNFVPLAGEIIIYDKDDNHPAPRVKIGNGVDNINDLEFASVTKTEIDNLELITVADIDAICGDLSLDVNMTLTNFSVTDDGQGNVVVTRQEG